MDRPGNCGRRRRHKSSTPSHAQADRYGTDGRLLVGARDAAKRPPVDAPDTSNKLPCAYIVHFTLLYFVCLIIKLMIRVS